MKTILLLISGFAFGAYTIKPDPKCVIKGEIKYIFGGKKVIDRPINCAFSDKPELTFCEGDEVISPKGKNPMRVLTLVPEMAYILAPDYSYKNQNIKLDSVENAKNYDCTARLDALKKEIKWVVINEPQSPEKSKETK